VVSEAIPDLSRRELLAERLVSLALSDPALEGEAKECISYLPIPYGELWDQVFAQKKTKELSSKLEPLFLRANLRSSLISDDAVARRAEWDDVTRHLRKEHYKALQDEWMDKIHAAEASHDDAAHELALKEFARISKEKEFDHISRKTI